MPLKTMREYPLYISSNVSVTFGTIDKKDPRVDYLNVKMWVTPEREFDYKSPINHVCSNIKRALRKTISDCYLFDGRCMIDISANPDGMEACKPSFVSIQAFMRQKGENVKPVHELCDDVTKRFRNAIMETIYSLNDYGFSVSKSKACKHLTQSNGTKTTSA